MKRQTVTSKTASPATGKTAPHPAPGRARTLPPAASAFVAAGVGRFGRPDALLRMLSGFCLSCLFFSLGLGLLFQPGTARSQTLSANGAPAVRPPAASPVASPAAPPAVSNVTPGVMPRTGELRIRIMDAAIVSGPVVLLGEIAQPVGEYDEAQWRKLAVSKLWESPGLPNRPVTMSRQRLQQAMTEHFPKLSFIYPNTLALQRGGALLLEQDLISLTVKTLTPVLSALGGEAAMHNYHMPPFVFLSHPQQRAELEIPAKLSGGRLTLRFLVKEQDDTLVKKFSGSVFLDHWKEVPCATQPLNKEDLLDPARVTFVRKNMAYLREEPWDGKGGHLRLVRPVGTNQVIYQNDVAQVPFIRKGNNVTVLYEGKTFQVSVRGEAMSDGFPGENIPVRNLQSNKQVFATVRDQQTVIVK